MKLKRTIVAPDPGRTRLRAALRAVLGVTAAVTAGLLGVLHPGLLVLRLEETAVGALGAAIAVALVLPLTTHAATDAWIRRTLHAVHSATTAAVLHLGDRSSSTDARGTATAFETHVGELDLLLGRVRAAVAPLVHPLSPLRGRKERARSVLVLLDDCARQVRGLAEVVADPRASHDDRLLAACRRVESAVLRLMDPHADASAASPASPAHESEPLPAPAENTVHLVPGAERALAHLHGLERALIELHAPLRSAAPASLAA